MPGVDLHIHTSASDGTDSPQTIIDLAEAHNLSVIAITDHDTFAGVEEAVACGTPRGIHVVPGIEVSAGFQGKSIHILGLGIRKVSPDFQSMLNRIRQGRKDRNPRIIQKLNLLGLDISVDDVAACAKGDIVGRMHIAQAMVSKGFVKNMDQAFRQYLARGAGAYVERFRPEADVAITMIRDAGGVAVLAHPGLIKVNGDLSLLKKQIITLKSLGLQALESHYPLHSGSMFKFLSDTAEELNLMQTGGSDFHGNRKTNTLGIGTDGKRISQAFVEDLLNTISVKLGG